MGLRPETYEAWVYSRRTAKVDEVRLYATPRFEALLNRWPFWIPLLWLPVAAWLAGPLSAARGTAMGAGFLLWPLLEVAFHRYLFHMKVRGRITQRLHITLHGSHHLAPDNPGRLASHPTVIALYTVVIYGLLWFLRAPHPDAVLAGLLVSYVRCDLTHAAVHLVDERTLRRVPILGRFLAACRRHHMAHHHSDPHANFPISFVWPRRSR